MRIARGPWSSQGRRSRDVIDFELGTRLRFNGVASIEDDDPPIESYPGTQFVVRVRDEIAGRNAAVRWARNDESILASTENLSSPTWRMCA